MSRSDLPWYKNGLKFKCTGCGQCCTGAPGYVWVTEDEMNQMASLLQISISQFKRTYTRQKDNRYALTEKKNDNSCVFLKENRCQIYSARPSQCRTYPWWKENLNSEKSWALAAEQCEGINDDSPTVSFGEIQNELKKTEK